MKLRIKHLLENLDLLNFLEDRDIDYQSVGKNIGEGWIGIETCPFCDAPNYHFGINIQNKNINCWVCETTGTLLKFLMKIEDVSLNKAVDIIQEYVNGHKEELEDKDIEAEVKETFKPSIVKTPVIEVLPDPIQPPGELITDKTLPRRPKLEKFLFKRGISLDSCKKFNLRYDYEKSLRLIIPIYMHNIIFAYQGRDVTERAMFPYITQPRGIKLGSVLFNYKNWIDGNIAIVVEGALDVIRLDFLIGSYLPDLHHKVCPLGCFTNKPTDNQVLLLKNASKIIAMFDNDSWFNYKKLQDSSVDVEPVILPSGKDPGSLTAKDFISLKLETLI